MFEFLVAFGAGLISFLSPCVLPLIPGYISFISGQSLQNILATKKVKLLPLVFHVTLLIVDLVPLLVDNFL